MQNKIIVLTVLALLVMPALPAIAQDDTSVATDTEEVIDAGEVGILPTNPFYFLKEWGRGLRRSFIFDPVERARFELRVADEKADELGVVSEIGDGDEEAIERAAQNYNEAMDRLRERLENLGENSENPEIDRLLGSLSERIERHQAVLSGVAERHEQFERLREQLGDVSDRVGQFVGPILERAEIRERVEDIDREEIRERVEELREEVEDGEFPRDIMDRLRRFGAEVELPNFELRREDNSPRSEIEDRARESRMRFEEETDEFRARFEEKVDGLRTESRLRIEDRRERD